MKKKGRKLLKPDKRTFMEIYNNPSIKAADLAKAYNVTEQTIYNWAYQMRKEKENGN